MGFLRKILLGEEYYLLDKIYGLEPDTEIITRNKLAELLGIEYNSLTYKIRKIISKIKHVMQCQNIEKPRDLL